MTILDNFIFMVKKYHILKEFDDIELVKLGDDDSKDLTPQATGDRRIDNIINRTPQSKYENISNVGEWVYRFLHSLDNPEMIRAVVDVFKGAEDPSYGSISSIGDNFKRTEVNKAGAKILYNLFAWMNESRKNVDNFGKLIRMFPSEALEGIRKNIKDYRGAIEKSGLYQAEIEKFFRDLTVEESHPQSEGFLSVQLEQIKNALLFKRLFG